MNPENIHIDSHYAARFGPCTWTVRIDAVNTSAVAWLADDYTVWVCELREWRRLPASAILRPSLSPDEYVAIFAQRQADQQLSTLTRLARQEAQRRGAPLRDRGPNRLDYGTINRQGTKFCPGDYGITRE